MFIKAFLELESPQVKPKRSEGKRQRYHFDNFEKDEVEPSQGLLWTKFLGDSNHILNSCCNIENVVDDHESENWEVK